MPVEMLAHIDHGEPSGAATLHSFLKHLPMSQTMYVVVQVKIDEDLDAQDVISNCDYSFLGDGILDTEIVEVYDQNDYKVF